MPGGVNIPYHNNGDGTFQYWPDDNVQVIEAAINEANAYGLSGMDALHVAAAFLVSANELVMIEKPQKSIHCSQSVTIITIP